MGERVVAIIPARGGSKGIPRKNIYPVGGKPLLWWTINQCQRTPEIDAIYVSTDDEAVAAVARESGASVITRPAAISGDDAPSEAALLHALETIERLGSNDIGLIVFLQATSPLRHPDDLTKGIALMRTSGADSLFSCHLVEDLCLWEHRANGYEPLTYDFRHRRPRQLEPVRYLENGSFYMMRPSHLKQSQCRLGGKIEACVIESWKGLQIDELDDIRLVECFLDRVRPLTPVTP